MLQSSDDVDHQQVGCFCGTHSRVTRQRHTRMSEAIDPASLPPQPPEQSALKVHTLDLDKDSAALQPVSAHSTEQRHALKLYARRSDEAGCAPMHTRWYISESLYNG